MVVAEYVVDETFTLRDFLRLFLLDEDLSVTFVRKPDGVRVESRVRLGLVGECVGIKIEVGP